MSNRRSKNSGLFPGWGNADFADFSASPVRIFRGNQPEKEEVKMAKQEHKIIPFTGNDDGLPPAA